jgi:hypothetical protein
VLLRACPSTSSHTRPQLREDDGAFVAVERPYDYRWFNIRRGGQEKTTEKCVFDFPPTVGDVDMKRLNDLKFFCPGWRDGDCGAGAGEGDVGRGDGGGGGGGGQLRERVCNAAAAAVEVRSAVDAAAAMQCMLSGSGWTSGRTNHITVDLQAGCVSHQQGDDCIIFSVGGGPRVQFVKVKGLPPSFIDVQRAREMKPDQNTHLQPLTDPAISPPGSRKIRAPVLCCARTHPGLQRPVRPLQSAGGHTARDHAVCR